MKEIETANVKRDKDYQQIINENAVRLTKLFWLYLFSLLVKQFEHYKFTNFFLICIEKKYFGFFNYLFLLFKLF